MQIQFLILQMERQLVIITAMIDRLRRRWGLQRGQRRPRRYWVRRWLSQAEREEESQYTRLMPMLELVSPGMKLVVTLRHLASGDSYPTLQYTFRVAWSTINKLPMLEFLNSGMKLVVTLRHLASGDSYPTLQYAFRMARSIINKFKSDSCCVSSAMSPCSVSDICRGSSPPHHLLHPSCLLALPSLWNTSQLIHLWTPCLDLCGHPLHHLTTSPLDPFLWWHFTKIFNSLF